MYLITKGCLHLRDVDINPYEEYKAAKLGLDFSLKTTTFVGTPGSTCYK